MLDDEENVRWWRGEEITFLLVCKKKVCSNLENVTVEKGGFLIDFLCFRLSSGEKYYFNDSIAICKLIKDGVDCSEYIEQVFNVK